MTKPEALGVDKLEKIVAEMATSGLSAEDAAKSLGYSNTELIEGLKLHGDKLDLLAEQYAQNLLAIEANTAAILDSKNSSNDKYNNSQYKDFIKAISELISVLSFNKYFINILLSIV